MNWLESSHQILSGLVLATWFAGFALLIAGPKAKRHSWICVSALAIFILVFGVDLFFIQRDMPTAQKIWSRGWIGPRDQSGAITIGMIEDSLGLTASLAAAILGLFLAGNRWLGRGEEKFDRVHAGLLMAIAGVAMAWLSLTPWFGLFGVAVASLGAFVALGARQDPEVIAQYGGERTLGFVLSFLGCAVLAGGRSALSMDRGFSMPASSFSPVFETIGAILLFLGLGVQSQPFPFLNWLVRPARVPVAASVVVAQILPAFAAFALTFRFDQEIRATGIFPALEGLALGSAGLAAICAMAQESWRTALPLWVSSSFAIAFATLCSAGPANAFQILLGTALSGSALSVLGTARENGVSGSRGRDWFKPLVLFAAAPGIGLIGFISSGAEVRAISLTAHDPVRATFLALVLLMAGVALWKSVFSLLSSPEAKPGDGSREIILPYILTPFLVVLSLGLIWTGTASGGVIPHEPDRLFPSWLGILFGAPASDWGDESGIALGQGLFWSAFVVAGLTSFSLFGRGQDVFVRSLGNSPGLKRFLQSGYSIDRLGLGLMAGLRSVGQFLEGWLTGRVSAEWIPRMIEAMLSHPARWIHRADRRVYAAEESVLRQWVEVPAKMLQLIQNGDLQWYLVFAIGCVMAILLHFLRT